jgi:outer membrane protein TolC
VVLDPVAAGFRALTGLVLAVAAAVPAPAYEPAPEGEARPMGLSEAVLLALERNLDLEIERAEPLIAGFRIEEAKAEFDPTFQWTTEYKDGERFVNSVLETSPLLEDDGTIDEKLLTPRWDLGGKATSGTEYGITLVTPALETNNPLRLFDVSYTPQFTFSVKQSLLRGRSKEINRVRIREAENLLRHSRIDLESRMLDLVHQVERAYWTAAWARERLRIALESLELAESLVVRLEQMMNAGMAKEFDLLKPRLEVERRRSDAARSEADLLNAQTRLRALIDPSLGTGTRITTTDDAPIEEPPPTWDAILETALQNRPELQQQELIIQNSEMERDRADDDTQWRFDATGKTWYSGLGGEDPSPLVLDPVAIDRDDFLEAFRDGVTSWSVGFDLLIPLGQRKMLAAAGPARLRLRQETARLQVLRNRVAVDVETSFRDLTAEWTRIQIARGATSLAREQYDTEQRNLETGLATIVQVIEAQDYLTGTLDAENDARLRYRFALSTLDLAQALAFDTYGLKFQE